MHHCMCNPCQNGATCLGTWNNPTCICMPGYQGKYCEISKIYHYILYQLRLVIKFILKDDSMNDSELNKKLIDSLFFQ